MACRDATYASSGMYHRENGGGNRQESEMQIPIASKPGF